VTEDLAVFSRIVETTEAGRGVVLATIVRARGSTPRGVGSKMLIDAQRGLVGTIGGGCGEAQVIETAGEVLRTGRSRVVRVDLTEEVSGWSPAICGGIFDVLLEPVSPPPGDG
jgi:xanthine/CO dehydrogenase XdhC/CoxF family maturation factor